MAGCFEGVANIGPHGAVVQGHSPVPSKKLIEAEETVPDLPESERQDALKEFEIDELAKKVQELVPTRGRVAAEVGTGLAIDLLSVAMPFLGTAAAGLKGLAELRASAAGVDRGPAHPQGQDRASAAPRGVAGSQSVRNVIPRCYRHIDGARLERTEPAAAPGEVADVARSKSKDVVPDPKGGWKVTSPGRGKESHHRTQANAERAAKGRLGHEGGGEARIHDRKGRIRDSDTVPPAKDPNPPKDKRH